MSDFLRDALKGAGKMLLFVLLAAPTIALGGAAIFEQSWTLGAVAIVWFLLSFGIGCALIDKGVL